MRLSKQMSTGAGKDATPKARRWESNVPLCPQRRLVRVSQQILTTFPGTNSLRCRWAKEGQGWEFCEVLMNPQTPEAAPAHPVCVRSLGGLPAALRGQLSWHRDWDWGEGRQSAAPPEQRLGPRSGQRSAGCSVLLPPSREADVSAVPCPRRDASGGLRGRRR